ncbi:hypothetical protein ACI1US_00446 [Leucobacter sp. BZR 635]
MQLLRARLERGDGSDCGVAAHGERALPRLACTGCVVRDRGGLFRRIALTLGAYRIVALQGFFEPAEQPFDASLALACRAVEPLAPFSERGLDVGEAPRLEQCAQGRLPLVVCGAQESLEAALRQHHHLQKLLMVEPQHRSEFGSDVDGARREALPVARSFVPAPQPGFGFLGGRATTTLRRSRVFGAPLDQVAVARHLEFESHERRQLGPRVVRSYPRHLPVVTWHLSIEREAHGVEQTRLPRACSA